jgi:hypothetical protein
MVVGEVELRQCWHTGQGKVTAGNIGRAETQGLKASLHTLQRTFFQDHVTVPSEVEVSQRCFLESVGVEHLYAIVLKVQVLKSLYLSEGNTRHVVSAECVLIGFVPSQPISRWTWFH